MFLSSDYKYIYHISIIDYLQDYNWDKKSENFLKRIWRGNKAEISAVNPNHYARRFINFMANEVILPDHGLHKQYSKKNEAMEKLKEIQTEERKEHNNVERQRSADSWVSYKELLNSNNKRNNIE